MEPRQQEDRTVTHRMMPADSASSTFAELGAASRHLDELRERLRDERQELLELRAHASSLRSENESLRRQVVTLGTTLGDARAQAASRAAQVQQLADSISVERERAEALAAHLKNIHHALFAGRVHDLILRACLALTGATRGAYVTVAADGRARVRARVGMAAAGPHGQPSPFIAELATLALRSQDAFVCNDGVGSGGLPQPVANDERFRNYAVAPIVLMRDLDGVLIVADKPEGTLDGRDMEMLLSVGDQASIAVENARLRRDLEGAYLSTVTMLADAAEAKDAYTHGHCETVSRYARCVAEKLQMDEDDVRLTCYAALLHDIGKIGVSDGILHKPGPLLPEERELMRSHVRVGYDLLRTVPALAQVADIVLHHHEWWDGTGYPTGLQGEAIPRPARIVSVVDAYCAMVDRRSYKEPRTDAEARVELHRCKGTQFEPAVVEAFCTLLDDPTMKDADDDFDAECGLPPMARSPLRVQGL